MQNTDCKGKGTLLTKPTYLGPVDDKKKDENDTKKTGNKYECICTWVSRV